MNVAKYSNYIKHGGRILCKGRMMPCYVTFFVTSKCNMHCLHCFYWRELNGIKNELTLDEIAKISKSMGNILLLMLTGGESLLREDLADIAEIFCRNNKLLNLVIPTNGYHTSRVVHAIEEILQRVSTTNITVSISFDALKEKHDKIRETENSFNNAVTTSKALISLKQKYSNLNVGISMTMMQENEEELISVYRFAQDEIKPDNISLTVIRGDVKDRRSKEINIKNFESLSKIIDKTSKGYEGFPFSSFTSIINMFVRDQMALTFSQRKWIMPCYAGRVNAVIYPTGDVYFCELIDKKIGNLRDAEYNFRKIWYSSKADDVRRFIKKEKCFCIHGCNIYTNILFNPRYFLIILRKWLWQRIARKS